MKSAAFLLAVVLPITSLESTAPAPTPLEILIYGSIAILLGMELIAALIHLSRVIREEFQKKS